MKKKKSINKFDSMWIELGIKSFARFYNLSIEEVHKMASNPNDVFYDMMGEMSLSLNSYENFMVKIKQMEEKEVLSRLDMLDL